MKKFERGGASVVALVVIVVLLAGVVISYITHVNLGNRLEVAIKARVADNENVYANGTQKVLEIAQVPAMYADDVKKVTREAISGRYGPEGSKAVFQMLTEQNPQLDPGMYKQIQQAIESFRNEFKNSQTVLLEQCRNYETARGNVWSGLWLNIAGYPKIDIAAACTIVTTEKARQTFETKRDSGVQLRPAQ